MKRPWHPLPAEVVALVERTPATVLLDCSDPAAPGAISRLFVSPLQVLVAWKPSELAGLFAQVQSAVDQDQFAAGFFSYECGAVFEPKAASPPKIPELSQPLAHKLAQPMAQPLAWFGIFGRCFLFDHAAGAFVDGEPPELAGMRSDTPDQSSFEEALNRGPLDLSFGLALEEYVSRIESIHELIRAGDVYQLNFTFPLRARVPGSPAALYRQLSKHQPVKYGAFLHWQANRHILSFSPELFFEIDGSSLDRRITTRPMKGTAPRGRTTAEDRQFAEWLRNDAKNRSENVMIVDLLRNDLGRLCSYGSVRGEDLFSAARYPSLWQMTSTVTGILRPEVSYAEIFGALFPCGSVTGAPKVHAMDLLARIEEEPRGIYTGAIGFFSRSRTVFNVAIRTLDVNGENATMGIGSGIVIDSKPEDEFRECQLKAAFLTRDMKAFSLIETLLWQGGYPLIELHLDRLEDSAAYFGFDCDRAAVRAALLAEAANFSSDLPHKVRLLVNADGGLHIAHEELESAYSASTPPGRVCFAPQRTDSNDRMLFHKTTHRELYDESLKTAMQRGFCDVLFLNERGEVTEGAISNLFIEKAGRWSTPPVESGLLAGIYRRHLLATKPGIEERILRVEDLQNADAIYLTNAVRGLRRVRLEGEE